MVPTTLLAAAAVIISLVSFVVNFRMSSASDRRGRMPVLVMERLETDAAGIHHILMRNVGNGPAMNIIFGLGEETPKAGSAQLRKGVHESWLSPLHLVPIPPDGTLDVAHPQSSNLMGAIYTDALGRPYTVKTSQYGTLVLEGRHLPEIWTMDNVPATWDELPGREPWLRTTPNGRAIRHRSFSDG